MASAIWLASVGVAADRRLEVRRDLGREEQDAHREDDRDHAGLVDAQRQEGRATLVHAPAANAADAYWMGMRRWPSWM